MDLNHLGAAKPLGSQVASAKWCQAVPSGAKWRQLVLK
jgi:hypothetical protein